jgi:hypothetical protein
LAKNLGIALGLTNMILRRVVRKGWVRMIHVRANRVRYLLTPTGIAEKVRMSRDSLQYSVRLYLEARERVSARFAALSKEWPGDSSEKRIIFFGTGEIAEIGYICLQETDLTLVGAIDDQGKSRFFDVPLRSLHWCQPDFSDQAPYWCLVVMSFDDVGQVARKLQDAGIPNDRICWL